MPHKSHAVEDVLDELKHAARSGQSSVSVGDAVEAIGHRGYGPLLFVPALIAITPVGGVPGVPSLMALLIAIFAVQLLIGRDHVAMPAFLERRSVPDGKLRRAVKKLYPLGRWLDRWFPGRLSVLVGPPAHRLVALCSLLLCLAVPPLEVVPFAAAAPMGAIAIFGLAMTLRDGVLIALGFAATIAALAVSWPLLPF